VDDAGLSAGLAVRRARADELAACAELYVRVLSDTFTWMDPRRHKAQDFLRAARDEEVHVAVEPDGRIVGLAAVYAPQNFLHSLYVADRGRGVGKRLLDHVAATLDGPMSLKCQAENLRAQAFYAREGFRCVERGADGGIAWVRLARE